MDENDLGRIEQLLIKVVDAKMEEVSTKFDAKLENASSKFDAKLERFKHEIIAEFDHRLTLQTEGFQHGLTVVAEGHQMLSEKLAQVETRIEQVESSLGRKIDAVAAHRSDTEAHHGVYRVKEG